MAYHGNFIFNHLYLTMTISDFIFLFLSHLLSCINYLEEPLSFPDCHDVLSHYRTEHFRILNCLWLSYLYFSYLSIFEYLVLSCSTLFLTKLENVCDYLLAFSTSGCVALFGRYCIFVVVLIDYSNMKTFTSNETPNPIKVLDIQTKYETLQDSKR